jgi:site-specific DNA recombinase
MRVAVYARVSTTRQAQAQGIEQQLDRLRTAAAERGWELDDQHVYRDDGYSGARIGRPGLDRLRDHAALAELDLVLVTAPDRLARNYVHQVLLIDELAARGCQVEFLDRPMSADPHDQLLLQIRGAVAEYERTLIAERMRRGRQAKLRAGTLLPWTTAPFGYRLDPERPRRADAVRVDPGEAALVAQLFDWYLEPQATIYRLAARLTDLGVPTPMGGPRWNTASVRGILRNPSYAGRALSNRTQVAPARGRKSAMLPAGPGISHAPRPEPEWIAVPVPPVVSEEVFAQVQAKLDANRQGAARNTRHEYLLRALISCGACRLGCTGRQTAKGYRYYLCRGRTDPLRVAQDERCTARYIPAGQLDELVWADLCALLTDPAQVTRALARAQGGAWLPQELQARQATIGQALGQLERQQQRLLDAYLAEVITLAELDRKRQDLDRRRGTLLAQQRQLDAAARQKLELGAVADGIEAFCLTVRAGLAAATFDQRRQLAELLIDRVIVTDGQVEIRYVLPTSPEGPHRPFCQLRIDHLAVPAHRVGPGDGQGGCLAGVVQGGDEPVVLGPGRPGGGGDGDVGLDHADRDAAGDAGRGTAAVAGHGQAASFGGLGDHRQVGPVAELRDPGQDPVGADPPDQVGAEVEEVADQRVAAEVPVGQDDRPRDGGALGGSLAGQRVLAGAPRAERGGQQGPGAAGDQDQQPDLRVAGLPAAISAADHGGLPERRDVGGGIGHVHDGAVHRGQHQLTAERAGLRLLLRGRRGAQPAEDLLQRLGAEPAPGPGQRRAGHHPAPARDVSGDLAENLPVSLAAEQRQPDHEIRHQHGWQRADPPLSPAASGHDLADQIRRHQRRDHPQIDLRTSPGSPGRPGRTLVNGKMNRQRGS